MSIVTTPWQSRPPRERAVLATGAVIVAMLLIAVLAWIPLERARTRLAAELPRLRASVVALERDAAEVRRLRAIAPPAAASPAFAATPRDLPGAQVTMADEKHVRLHGDDVAFTALLEWLGAAQSANGLRVESARIEALPSPGRVRADLTLARS
jgi:general secretion pathway protein M